MTKGTQHNLGKKLTPKQKKFADKYLETGNGTKAAKEAYDVKNNVVAGAVSYENLRKPQIEAYLESHVQLAQNELIKILKKKDAKDTDKIAVAKDILDRTQGRPVQRQINANTDTDKEYRWAE